MTDFNMVAVHGRVVRNAEYTTNDSGLTIARFSLAVNRARKLEDGQWVNDTAFIPFAVFGKRANSLVPFIKKGRGMTVEGHLRQNHWEKDGEKREELAVSVSNILFDPVIKKAEETPAVKDVNAEQKASSVESRVCTSDEDCWQENDFDFTPPEVSERFDIY